MTSQKTIERCRARVAELETQNKELEQENTYLREIIANLRRQIFALNHRGPKEKGEK